MKNNTSIGEIKIGDAIIEFELPTTLYNLISENSPKTDRIKLYSYNSDTIVDIFRSLMPEGIKPPTQKQESFAKTIADRLNIELTEDIIKTASSCSSFLDQYSEQYYKEINKETNHLRQEKGNASQATRINRWLSAQEMLNAGIPIEKVAEELGIKKNETIEKYCNQLSEWQTKAKTNGTYAVIMNLVSRQRAGEDIYISYADS